MKKLLCLFAFMLTLASYCEEELSKEIWEVAPGIISGGYTQETGPYIFKFLQTLRPVLGRPAGSKDRYGAVLSATISVGYGDFMVHTEPDPDDDGYVPPASVSDSSISFAMSISSLQFVPSDYTYSVPGTYYVYKKEFIEPLLGDFNHDNYNIKVGQFFRVGFPPTGGSGYYSISVGSKPAFLVRDDVATWSGTCYTECLTSISIIVTDIVTGETREAFATIIVSEDPEDPTFPDDTTDVDDTTDDDDTDNTDTTTDSSDPGTSSDPGDTATDPSSSDSSGDDGTSTDTSDDGTSVDSGDTSNYDGDSAVDPGSSDDDPEAESDDSSDNDEADTDDGSNTDSNTATDPGSTYSTDFPTDNSTADNSDSSGDSTDTADSSGGDDVVVVVPDGTDTSDTSDGSDISDVSDSSDITSDEDTSDAVIISDTTEEDEPTVIVINDSSDSATDKIVVTDDSVITTRKDNYDLAIFMSMFGAITGLNGSMAATTNTSMAVQEARGGKGNE
jgi:hypothetical protein